MNDTDMALAAAFDVMRRRGGISKNQLEIAIRQFDGVSVRQSREIHRLWRMEMWNSGLCPWLQDGSGEAVWIPADIQNGEWK